MTVPIKEIPSGAEDHRGCGELVFTFSVESDDD